MPNGQGLNEFDLMPVGQFASPPLSYMGPLVAGCGDARSSVQPQPSGNRNHPAQPRYRA